MLYSPSYRMAATKGFPGFPPEGLKFLRDLKKHNDRDWFTPRKDIFDRTLRLPMLELVSQVHRKMLDFAPQYVGEPAKCLYRIYRDTRFAKDKTPYKDHVGALLWRNGIPKNAGAAYYFGISGECVEIAGGLYSPEPDTLLAVRQLIAAAPDEFRATYDKPKIRRLLGDLKGEVLSRVPKGFDAESDAADLVKHKRFILYIELDAALATTPKLLPEIVTRLEAMVPFVEYLNRPLARKTARIKVEERFLR